MSTDGDSHEILTLVACVSGLAVAVIVITIIVFVMDCGNIDVAHVHRNKSRLCDDIEAQLNETESATDAEKNKQNAHQNRMQIFTILDGNKETFEDQLSSQRA